MMWSQSKSLKLQPSVEETQNLCENLFIENIDPASVSRVVNLLATDQAIIVYIIVIRYLKKMLKLQNDDKTALLMTDDNLETLLEFYSLRHHAFSNLESVNTSIRNNISFVLRYLGECADRNFYHVKSGLFNARIFSEIDCVNSRSKFLGKGSFGKVYKKEIKGFGFVAIKTPCGSQERWISASLSSHSNIVMCHGLWIGKAARGLVFEVLPQTLENIIKRSRQWPVHNWAKMAMDIASGLAHIHANHLVHYDIKPENVLVGERSICKITDFGLSASGAVDNIRGDWHYMAPEIYHKLRLRGPASAGDIFSLGVVLYELITGRYRRWSIAEDYEGEGWYQMKMEDMHPSIPDFVAQDIADVMEDCWQKPRKRLTALELYNRLTIFSAPSNIAPSSSDSTVFHNKAV